MKEHRFFRQDSGPGSVPPLPSSGSTETSDSASPNSIIALVLGIISWFGTLIIAAILIDECVITIGISWFGCLVIASIPAWIMGLIELNAIKARRAPQAGRTIASIGMWFGIVNLILCIVFIIVLVVQTIIFVGS